VNLTVMVAAEDSQYSAGSVCGNVPGPAFGPSVLPEEQSTHGAARAHAQKYCMIRVREGARPSTNLWPPR